MKCYKEETFSEEDIDYLGYIAFSRFMRAKETIWWIRDSRRGEEVGLTKVDRSKKVEGEFCLFIFFTEI